PYEEHIARCDRPEQIDGPSEEMWKEINVHFGTRAKSLPELVRELGERRFGHVPRVGDAFCGGGSIPFEAARIGCDAYGSDLNPVAALLTWAALNVVGGGEEVAQQVRTAQGTIEDGYIVHPELRKQGKQPASIDQVRLAARGKVPGARYHANGLRLWENDDVVPRPEDAFQERLYCVRWVTAFQRENAKGETV